MLMRAQNDANHLAPQLREVANCLDESIEDREIEELLQEPLRSPAVRIKEFTCLIRRRFLNLRGKYVRQRKRLDPY